MSWWRRREEARERHPSRVDLVTLWGPDDDTDAFEPVPPVEEGVTPVVEADEGVTAVVEGEEGAPSAEEGDEDVAAGEDVGADGDAAADGDVAAEEDVAADEDVAAGEDVAADVDVAAGEDVGADGDVAADEDATSRDAVGAPALGDAPIDEAASPGPVAATPVAASAEGRRTVLLTEPAAFAPPPATVPARDRPADAGRGRAGRVVLLAAVIAAGLLVDQAIGHGKAPAAQAATPLMPTMAPAGALSSTWLCPALGASAASPAAGRLLVANPSAAPLTATATIVPATGGPIVQHLTLAPYARQEVVLDTTAPGDYAAATVTFDGATGAVEQEVQGPLGLSVTPCATGASAQWYFPTGETDAGAEEYLSLFNPFPAPAIADLRFETDQGEAVPEAFQGVVVPGNGFTVLDVGARVRSRTQVATVVSVRGGRIVADELQTLNTGAHGLVLTLGAPAPATSWYYANGAVGPGVRERFDLFNPGTAEATVSVAPILEQGSAEPFSVSVPPLAVVSLEVDQQPRIPPGVGEAWVLTSTGGPVVPERVITSSGPGTAAGTAGTIGAPATARRWVFAAGSTTNGADERLVIANPGGGVAHVSLVASGQGTAVRLPPVVVPSAGRVSVDITRLDPADVVMLDLSSDVPVVAERALYGSGASNAVGIAGA
jgi:hypothetical protein